MQSVPFYLDMSLAGEVLGEELNLVDHGPEPLLVGRVLGPKLPAREVVKMACKLCLNN